MDNISDLDVAKKMVAIKMSADNRGIEFDLSLKSFYLVKDNYKLIL